MANDAKITEDGKWSAVWRHDTDLGHDKALSIQEYRADAKLESDNGTVPMIIFIGDGVSDLAAAREADVLFARRGLRLEEYCLEHKIKHIAFDTFADIQKEVIKIAKVDDAKTQGKGLPSNFNPRANMWRRVSSKAAVPMFSAFTPRDEKVSLIFAIVLFVSFGGLRTAEVKDLTGASAIHPSDSYVCPCMKANNFYRCSCGLRSSLR